MPAPRSTRFLPSLALCALLAACGDEAPHDEPTTDVSNADADVGLDAGDSGTSDAGDTADTTATDTGVDGDDIDRGDATSDTTTDSLDGADASDANDTDAEEPPPFCASLTCGAGTCDVAAATCACVSGEWFDGTTCAPVQDCETEDCDTCPVPQTQTISPIASIESLGFTAGEATVEVGTAADLAATVPDAWTESATIELADFEGQRIRVFARVVGCDTHYNAVFDVNATYPPAAGEEGSTAVALDDDAVIGWASSVVTVVFGDDVDDEWRDTDNALGPAEGNAFDIVSLGRGGHIVLGFDAPISDGPGPDFAVFENSFSDTFLELGRVSVSSDGETFVAFEVAATGTAPMAAFDMMEPTTLGQFAGNYAQGWGSPFDLAALRQRREVRTGQLDLTAITHVRIDDVVGGVGEDSFGRTTYDPYPTVQSAGFDLDGVAVLGGWPAP